MSEALGKQVREQRVCPVCKGSSGYSGTMTETHKMQGNWGESPTAIDSGYAVRFSVMECLDCHARFQLRTCEGR